jgi:Cof subfamily protein (haloacid dehalogenase superfamily)
MFSTENMMYFQKLYKISFENKISNFRMVAFDLDGTLLDPNHQLSERTIATVKEIASQGMLVLLATARMASAVKKHLEKLGTPGLIVAHNGALVKDIKTNQICHHQTLSKSVVTGLLNLLEGEDTIVHFNCDDEIYLTNPNPYSEVYSQELEISLNHIFSFKNLEENPTTILLIDKKDVLEKLSRKLFTQFQGEVESVLVPWLDNIWRMQLIPPNTSKGKGVLQVAKYFGVKPEEIISFGDNYNDMEMIQSVGLGIAMGNAIPELKQVADFVTLSNQEDGVALALKALLGL